ncbi:MAG: IPT/TIG domain-containing protein [Acidimicrobiales bacterium]
MGDNSSVRRVAQVGLIVYIVIVAVLALIGGVVWWRAAEQATAAQAVQAGSTVRTGLLWWKFDVSSETAIFLVVIAFGVLGGVVHMTNSLASYIGNRRFSTSWVPWYALRPLIAAALAMLAYTVFRAGFLSTTAPAGNLNLFGVAAISGLAGLFSKQVIDKLGDVTRVIFASQADSKRTDKLLPVSIATITPTSTAVGTTVEVVITGTGFGEEAKVMVNDQERDPSGQGDGTIRVALTATDVAEAGQLTLRVKTASGELSNRVTFTKTT